MRALLPEWGDEAVSHQTTHTALFHPAAETNGYILAIGSEKFFAVMAPGAFLRRLQDSISKKDSSVGDEYPSAWHDPY